MNIRHTLARWLAPEIFTALASSFPHFEGREGVTVDGIKALGKEYLEMIQGWEPTLTEIVFTDQDGKERKLTYEWGDYWDGIASGWCIAESETWGVFDIMDDDAGAIAHCPTEDQR